jgi:acetoacetate decarboxylase
MDIKDVREKAYAMGIMSPAYPRGPIRFLDRETLTIIYKTDVDVLRRIVPAPLEVKEPIVKFEVINMPDSSGLGGYFESGLVIQVEYQGVTASFSLMMFLNSLAGIAAGRERFGFPKKMGHPKLEVQEDCLVGTLDYATTRVATATMGYKYQEMDLEEVAQGMSAPNYLLKIIPHVDESLRICELVDYRLTDVVVKGAWSGPGALSFVPHALAPLYEVPVREIIGASHILTDLTIDNGKVAYDYLEQDDN